MRNNLGKIFSLTRVNNNLERKLLPPVPHIVAINRSNSNVIHNQGSDNKVQHASPPAQLGNVEPLVDSFGRRHDYLRISLTERCNLRCQYCMPAEGVPLSPRSSLLSLDELSRLVRVFVRGGVNKARLTGGEPTLRADLAEVVSILREAGVQRVALTTNGLVLTRKLPQLQRAGLDALNISLDSMRADRYERMARRPGLKRVLAGIDLALQLGYTPVKINVVLMKGFNEDEISDFVEYTRDRDVEVRFIEFMPFTGNKWDDSKMVPYRKALRAVFATHPDLTPAPPRDNDTATVWRVPGYKGSVGFIHSMTEHFCSTCNRMRLTADGNLKVCLFGSSEVSLRDAVRGGATDCELDTLVRSALKNKKAKHAAWSRRRALSAAPRLPLRLAARQYSTQPPAPPAASPFTHLDSEGRARMVDVGDKDVTRRVAVASCLLHVNARLLRLLRDARLPKGDALTVAQVAGALGAKRTADLIPMCHTLTLDSVRVRITLPRGECPKGGTVTLGCEVVTHARTGVEMEALTGCAIAALALYDMCKSVDKEMRICELRVLQKSGGRSDNKGDTTPPKVRPHDETPHDQQETYAPTNLMHF